MNDSELTEKFWKYNEKEPLGAIAVALYFFLLEIWEKTNKITSVFQIPKFAHG